MIAIRSAFGTPVFFPAYRKPSKTTRSLSMSTPSISKITAFIVCFSCNFDHAPQYSARG